MRIAKIIAGISFTVLLWCGVGIYLVIQNPNELEGMLKISSMIEIPIVNLQIALIVTFGILIVGFFANLIYGSYNKFKFLARFNASAWKYYLFSLIAGLVTVLSLGVLKPFSDEYFLRWKWNNRRFKGQILPFTSKGDKIFFKNILWILLTVVTLGVYAFWYRAKLLSWQAEGLPSGAYKGNGTDLFVLALMCAFFAFWVFLYSYLFGCFLQLFNNLSLVMFFMVIFSIGLSIMLCYLYAYSFNKNLSFTWNRFEVLGTKFVSGFKFPNPNLFLLSIIVTFGIAIFVYPYYFECGIIGETRWVPSPDS